MAAQKQKKQQCKMKNIQKYKRKIKLCTSVLIINYVYRLWAGNRIKFTYWLQRLERSKHRSVASMMVPYLFIVLQRNRTYQRLRRLMPGCLLRRVERQHSLTTTSMPFGTNRSHQHLITCTTRHSIVRHAPQCRVLPPSEFNGMVTEPLIPVALLKYKHGYKPANIATKTCDQKQYLTGCYGQGNYTVSQKKRDRYN